MMPTAFSLPSDGPGTRTAVLYSADSSTRRPGLLVLAHGAGAGQSHPFMVTYAAGLAARGLDVVTFNFPYMDAGRRAPDRPPVLEAAFTHAVAAAAYRATPNEPLLIGGKSMGGRMAVRLAAAPETWPSTLPALAGVIAFGYPLNPPGRVASDRAAPFARLTIPTLIVQGTRDAFGGPDAIRQVAPQVDVHGVGGGDHSFAVSKSGGVDQQTVHAGIMDAVTAWTRKNLRFFPV